LLIQTVVTSDNFKFFIFPSVCHTITEIGIELTPPIEEHRSAGTIPRTFRIPHSLEESLSDALPKLNRELETRSPVSSAFGFEPHQLCLFSRLLGFLRFLKLLENPISVPYPSEQLLLVFRVLELPANVVLDKCAQALFHTFIEQLDRAKHTLIVDQLNPYDCLHVRRIYVDDGAMLYVPKSVGCLFQELFITFAAKLKEFRDSGEISTPLEALENPCTDLQSVMPCYSTHLEAILDQPYDHPSFDYCFYHWCFLKQLDFLWNDDLEVTLPIPCRTLREILVSLTAAVEMFFHFTSFTAYLFLIKQLYRQLWICP
jgi:hypothetical protein